MKIVRESIGDILKPKGEDDIRKEFKDLIFWKGVIDGKKSPMSLKYFLDKNFINDKGKKYGITPDAEWKKNLIFWVDTAHKRREEYDEIAKEIVKAYNSYKNNLTTLYKHIENLIKQRYIINNTKYRKNIGKNLRESNVERTAY